MRISKVVDVAAVDLTYWMLGLNVLCSPVSILLSPLICCFDDGKVFLRYCIN